MRSPKEFFRLSELDRPSFPEFRDRALRGEEEGLPSEPRSYPGYPHWPLDRLRPRLWPALDRVLAARRSVQVLGCELPSRRTLRRIFQSAPPVNAARGRGPVPSAGGLQALELYLV